MPAATPEQVNEQLIAALEQNDIDTAVALYEDNASFVSNGEILTGLDAIRTVLTGFAAVKPKFDIKPKPTVLNGDIALTGNNWSLTGTGPDGAEMAMSGSSYEVVRRGADGNWRFVIDNPDAE